MHFQLSSLFRIKIPSSKLAVVQFSKVSFVNKVNLDRSVKIGRILDRVRVRDGLGSTYPHIQYLIGGSKEVGGVQGEAGTLDIADKTQLILQSSHPVRYIIQRYASAFQIMSYKPVPLDRGPFRAPVLGDGLVCP